MVAGPSPEAFVIHDGQEVIYADPVLASLLGADIPEALVGTPSTELVTPDYQSSLQTQLDRINADTAPALGLSVALQTATDTPRDAVAVSSRVEWNGSDYIQTAFLPLAGDPRTAGATLRNQAMQHAPIGITMTDPRQPDNPIIYCNDGFTTLTGYPRDEVLGNNCRFLQGKDTREEPVAEMRAAIDAADPVTVELRNYRKDGSLFWNRVTIDPITTPDGELSHFVGFQQDISDEKLFAQEKSLFEQQAVVADQAKFVTDRDGTIITVNPAFEEMTGYSAEEAVGQTPRILKSGVQDAAFYKELGETISAGDVWEARLVKETKGGERYTVEQTIVPIEDDRGEITHFASIERNVTEAVVREQTVNVLNRLLRHNLRTSINVIEGYTEVLADTEQSGDHQAAITAIREQTASLKKLAARTDTIRTLAAGPDQSGVLDEATVTEFVAEFRRVYPAADITLESVVEDGVVVPGVALVELALEEAVENAVVHTDRATPTVALSVVQQPDDGRLLVRVVDDGPGIPADERAVIEGGAETPLTHGSGIGLWIIEWVVTSLGGEFTIGEGTPRGTELTLRVPTGS